MQPVPTADFLGAAILTWALPIGLLMIVGLYWWLVLRKSDLDDELDRDPSA